MVLSKIATHANCFEIFHPWTQDCTLAHRTILRLSILGCTKLMVPIMLVEFMLKLRKKKEINKQIVSDTIIDIFRSLTMGMCMTTSFYFFCCMFRNLLGRFTYFSVVFMPGILSGLSCIILTPTTKVKLLTIMCNTTLESMVLKASHAGLFNLNVYIETVFFMITNACLMYASKMSELKNPNYSWFFKPEKCQLSDSEKSLLKTIFKKARHYVGLGFGLGVLHMLINDISVLAPRNFHKIFNANTLRSGIFAGSYVAIYELTVYILNRYFQKDRSIHSLPAGFLAGLSYAISPNLTINLSALINLIQLLFNRIDTQSLRRIPLDTIVFCLSTGILFQIQMFYPQSTSKFGSKFIKMVTGKKSNLMIAQLKKFNSNVF